MEEQYTYSRGWYIASLARDLSAGWGVYAVTGNDVPAVLTTALGFMETVWSAYKNEKNILNNEISKLETLSQQ